MEVKKPGNCRLIAEFIKNKSRNAPARQPGNKKSLILQGFAYNAEEGT